MISLSAKPVVEKRRADLQGKTTRLRATLGRAPHLSVILIGDDPASQVYVGRKANAATKVGFTSETIRFPETVPSETVLKRVRELNADPRVDGILIQRPLPSQLKEKDVALWVDPSKDVDCLHPENIGLLVTGNPRFIPCTPGGILLLLDHYGIQIEGRTVCVVGRSAIVGKPLASLLLSRNASLIQLHRRTPDPASLCKLADLVFVAAGSRGLIKGDWLKPGSVVVDVGIHRDTSGRITGDVDTDSILGIPHALSPVPGGVGPMTIQVLLENTFAAASREG